MTSDREARRRSGSAFVRKGFRNEVSDLIIVQAFLNRGGGRPSSRCEEEGGPSGQLFCTFHYTFCHTERERCYNANYQ